MATISPIASPPPAWKTPAIVAGLTLLSLVAAALLLPCPDPTTHGMRLTLCLLAVEAIALAVGVPLLASLPAGGSWARRLLAILLPVLASELAAFVVILAATRGAVSPLALALAQVFLLGFAFLLSAVVSLIAACGARRATAQFVATGLALAMLGSVFFANALVEAAEGESAKMSVINTVLWTNPWLIVGGSILEADPLRSENLYSWSVIIYYGFQYPAAALGSPAARAAVATLVYGIAGLLLEALGWLALRIRRSRKAHAAP